jgi:hypothetical protein
MLRCHGPPETRLRAHQAWPFYRFISYTAKIEVERRRGGAGCSRMRPRSGLGSGDGAATAGTLEAEKGRRNGCAVAGGRV